MRKSDYLSFNQINNMLNNSDIAFSSFSSHSVKPIVMYRDIFSSLDLETKEEALSHQSNKYSLICLQMKYENNKRVGVLRKYIHKDLKELEYIINSKSKEFCVMSCVSYAGLKNKKENARYMYALVFDLDYLVLKNDKNGLFNLVEYYINKNRVPKPNYIVSSGHGIHLYYVFEKPIPMYKNIQDKIFLLKKALTKRLWNSDISLVKEQHGNVIQGFRVGGTITKDLKHYTKCFKTNQDKKYTLYDLASYCLEEDINKNDYIKIDNIKTSTPLKVCKEKYPEWYQKRIIEKQPKGKWNIKKDLYYWWLRKIEKEFKTGGRYWACYFACVYAVKCNIPLSQVKNDLIKLYDTISIDTEDKFTIQDLEDSFKGYTNTNYFWSRQTIQDNSLIDIKPNKRNGLKREEHLEIARHLLQIKNKRNGKALQGRKTKNNVNEIYTYILQESDKPKDIAKRFNISIRQAERYNKYVNENILTNSE